MIDRHIDAERILIRLKSPTEAQTDSDQQRLSGSDGTNGTSGTGGKGVTGGTDGTGAELAQAVYLVEGKVVEKCPKIARAMPETGAAVCPFRSPFNLSAIQTHPMISK